jgi:tetratricopeptide (TPR) repeat protein
MSQEQLGAEAGLTGSYVSYLEAGRRKPSERILERLAPALGCSVEYLRTGWGGRRETDVDLDLRFGELALRSGDAAAALERFTEILALAQRNGAREVEFEALWGRARALESVGSLDAAIGAYEALSRADTLPAGLLKEVVLTALCRAYRECGDLARAIEVGESALPLGEAAVDDPILNEASVALSSTLVGCYYERGDLTRGQLLARETLARAERAGSPVARAAALWNAGLISEAQGDLRTARSYVERALALYSETDNARATALLRVTAAWLMLRAEEPQLEEAHELLTRAVNELATAGSTLDMAYAETELARYSLLKGDWRAALERAEALRERLSSDGPRLEAARVRLVIGDAHTVEGDVEAAAITYAAAAADLRASGADRQAASAWREVAESLARLGRSEEALDAYRAASNAAGVLPPPYRIDEIKRSSRADLS